MALPRQVCNCLVVGLSVAAASFTAPAATATTPAPAATATTPAPAATATTSEPNDAHSPSAVFKPAAETRPPLRVRQTSDNRGDSRVTPTLIPFSSGTWIPYKWGAAASVIIDRSWTAEAEYLSGSVGLGLLGVDLAKVSERLVGLAARFYPGNVNSFNVRLGIGERRYQVTFGDSVAAKLVPAGTPYVSDTFSVSSYVLDAGVGNRWQLDSGFVVGVDWFEVYWPVGDSRVDAPGLGGAQTGSEKSKVEDVLGLLGQQPTFTVLKLGFGWSF